MFEFLFGAEVPPALKIFLAFIIVIALIGVTAWLLRRYGADRFGGSSARGRQPRLALVDAAQVDGRRRLIIVRRDNVEHLLMIGGPNDVVVEQNIVRAMGAPRDKTEPALGRSLPILDTNLPRPVPLGEGTMFPLQPQPEINGRPPRALPEEPVQWTWPEPQRTPPGGDDLTTLANDLTSQPAPQREPAPPRSAAPAPAPRPIPPVAAAPAPVEPSPAAGQDHNLTEMAHRLEAALRRPPEPRLAEPFVEPPAAKSEPIPAPRVTPPAAKPAEAKPAPAKAVYDSLEQEMASLLGRPPGKT